MTNKYNCYKCKSEINIEWPIGWSWIILRPYGKTPFGGTPGVHLDVCPKCLEEFNAG